MAAKSKHKGSAFERKVCVDLSRWVTEGAREDVFWRSAMSGGRATVGYRKGKDLRRQAGDICAVAPEGHELTDKFYIECKFYRNLRLEQFVVKHSGMLMNFWRMCVREAKKHDRIPMLIAKQNNTPTLLILPEGSIYTAKILFTLHGAMKCEVAAFDQVLTTRFDVFGP